ncbi:hypothetical protein VZT92_001310 [Zoarces viviparus]|uniref:EGF-like domain-containing protein n=1 Tax=Zoarces viviparus TaxID=48416 RepID=A0AAW1G2A4_ZOAVI
MDDVGGIHLCTWAATRSVLRTYLGVLVVLHLVLRAEASSVSKSCEKDCLSGKCINGTCACDHGWVGDQCQHCQGRFK